MLLHEAVYKAAKYLWATYLLNKDSPILTEKERIAISFLEPNLDIEEQDVAEHKYSLKLGHDLYLFELGTTKDTIKIYRIEGTRQKLYVKIPLEILSEL